MKAKINDVEINLSSHELESIPSEIFGLENRIILNVSHNKIKAGVYKEEKEFEKGKIGIVNEPYDGITVGIKKLTKLEKLYLNDNEILEIPQYLTEITTLKTLDLSSNNIEKISDNLLKLTNLEELNLSNNPVSQIKGFSLKNSPKEIIEFLLLNQDKKLTTLNEAKLLVVGDENSGKSSLVERMVHNKFNAEYNSTKGIDISQYPISKDLVESMLYFYCFGFKVEPNIKVNIWDFAGQEITYQVHNLFMSKESLYLLVIDGQKEDNIVENFDWLETISANADKPPIIIVVTKHENNRSHEIDEIKYKEEFPNIKEIHYVSSKENFGFCELKQSILLSLSKFSKQKIPKSYEVVKSEIEKKRIEKLEKNLYMLSADDFDDICSEHKMFEERDNIRTILNDIGVMIGMDNDDMHVINPTKMIDAIYEIIRSKKINDNGELELKKDKDRHYNWIIQFLIKNKIAFKIDDLKVMIPSRLPMKRPKGFLKSDFIRDDKIYGLNFRYKYKRFKKSVFFEFLIQIQEDIYDVQPEYWANGIIWKYDEFQVLVLASKVDRIIDIHISKDTEKARKLLTKIRKKLDEFNKGKWGIVQKVAVVDTDDNCIYYKSYKFLKEKLKKNAKEVELNIKEKPKIFPLTELLDRYEYVEEIKENDTLKPLIITEGKTDKRILEIAWKKLYNDIDMPFRIQDAGLERRKKEHGKYTENIEKSGGSDVLRQQLEHSTALNSELTIGVFDNDSAGYRDFKGLQESMFGKCSKTTKQRKHIQNNTYAILLPVPDFRRKFVSSNYPEQKYFVIEHYFLDEILEEYDMKGNPIVEDSQIFKIKGKKDDFSKSIEEINKEEFKHFKLLFDVIKEIIKENKSSNTRL